MLFAVGCPAGLSVSFSALFSLLFGVDYFGDVVSLDFVFIVREIECWLFGQVADFCDAVKQGGTECCGDAVEFSDARNVNGNGMGVEFHDVGARRRAFAP